MCHLAAVSRAGFYRWLVPQTEPEQEMQLRSTIQQIVLEHRRRYGYRRVTRELARRGFVVNHKRVVRLMRMDNLLAAQPRAFVSTTRSDPALEVHLNLAARMKLTGINQLWVADITYLRLRTEFVSLAVVLDACSRKVLGWELGRTLEASLALAALRHAIDQRDPPTGLVHHSDRGIQYACSSYAALLREHGMIPSMSRPANPYDNASCESFLRTLKREEIHATTYRDLDHLRSHLEHFLEVYDNRRRLHSSLGYRPPEEFERSLPDAASATASLSFFRHGEAFRSEEKAIHGGSGQAPAPPSHRLDEAPADDSSAGWSPPEPASASPAATILPDNDAIQK